MKRGKLYLIPVALSENNPIQYLSPIAINTWFGLNYLIAENDKTARKMMRSAGFEGSFTTLEIFPLAKFTDPREIMTYLDPIEKGFDMGLVSEAGSPAIADPGNNIVTLAQIKGIEVVSLPGPNSIMLALAASGFNGQQFTFHGYLPVNQSDRVKRLRDLEKTAQSTGYTQIFIETPFRNNALLEDMLVSCKPSTKLSIACNVTAEDEFIVTKSLENWRKQKPDLHKKPCVFSMYSGE